jgi:(2Fe-2S) ferredoxin
MPKFKHHLFICTNSRELDHPRGSCDPQKAGDLHREFKTKLAKRGIKDLVRANKAGCLDQCEHGPTVVVYPEEIWYSVHKPEDVDEIIESHIVNGLPVERLRIADDCLNNPSCPHRQKQI